ncbi:hypothetical protein MMC08_002813 [Hypocenomyce scalaris]|nr:hypothetical protein [Hypocenomyce scalaris]
MRAVPSSQGCYGYQGSVPSPAEADTANPSFIHERNIAFPTPITRLRGFSEHSGRKSCVRDCSGSRHRRNQSYGGSRTRDHGGKLPDVGITNSDGCASCSISIPPSITSRLPTGAPGSPREDGIGRNGSPVLRTREAIHACGSQSSDSDSEDDAHFHKPSPESYDSSTSTSSCHTHTLSYITASSPLEPGTYSLLRRACIRTLSCEQLPHGLTAGRLSFGDPTAGHVIAYKFRLPDPHARGCQRYYTLLALAGRDYSCIPRVSTTIWSAFEWIAAGIIDAAEQVAAHDKAANQNGRGKRTFTPVSSFLTGRALDPDGYPRRNSAATVRAKGLAELVGDEMFFAHLHGNFVALLHALGQDHGGVPVKTAIVDGGIRGLLDESECRARQDVDEADDVDDNQEEPPHIERPIPVADISQRNIVHTSTPLCTLPIVPQRQQLAV